MVKYCQAASDFFSDKKAITDLKHTCAQHISKHFTNVTPERLSRFVKLVGQKIDGHNTLECGDA